MLRFADANYDFSDTLLICAIFRDSESRELGHRDTAHGSTGPGDRVCIKVGGGTLRVVLSGRRFPQRTESG
jgi:hypothetical protein